MGILEFITSAVGAVVGAIVSGVMRLFGGRRQERERPRAQPIQSVIAIAPATLLQYRVPLTDANRDILEMPRWKEPDLHKPKLLVPGEGLVTPDTFIGYALETLLMEAAYPIMCVVCKRNQAKGAFFDGRWFCTKCFYLYVKDLVSGDQAIFSGRITLQTRTWTEIEEMLRSSDGLRMLSRDKTVQSLFGLAETLRETS